VAADGELYTHIRHMLYTAVPSFVMCLIVYSVAGRASVASATGIPESGQLLLADITSVFRLGWYASFRHWLW
jgi:NhaC family Na+:H+ antiporter